ncbi:MAG: Gfo/Idh/MocA family oxidoreductase [Planctomycetes bacterium]|nr:Gfo/Idh/MocA family oxidoreductase [Planctomycetota bacterium]MBL7145772.1 Gfo/Idh/MocA family oxidoreductase [Phycisphaerae bacterium]
MKGITRRDFLKGTFSLGLVTALPYSRVRGANDRINVGLVGCGGRGVGAHIPSFEKQEGVTIVALSDPDQQRMAEAAKIIESKYDHKVGQYVDMRKLLDRKDIDVIANATQNYWHGLSTIWASQAGKHVYVEKPLSHYIWEGRQMVNAARKYNRIVQCGTQRRSQSSIAKAIQWIQEGNLGKIRYITAFANKQRSSCGKRNSPLPIPDSIDYDLWCGPARKVPIYRDKLQYDCSFDWNTGDGESCNQGVHEVDVARWCLGEKMLPRRVMSIGGRFVFDDACDVPNAQIIYYDFPKAPVFYEVHNLTKAKGSDEMPEFRGERVGVIVDCEGGSVSLYRGLARDNEGKEVKKFSGDGDHFVNFIEAVRNGRREDLKAEVLEGHISTAITHTGNISLRLGLEASRKEMRTQVRDIPIFRDMLKRMLEHLKAQEINVNAGTVSLGPWLEIDRQNECFKDNEQANRLVRGFYREPYVVPDLSA